MSLLARVSGRARKQWSQPPLWSLDAMRNNLFSAPLPDRENIENDFLGYVQGAYKRSGPVFSVIRARQMVFAQARFGWAAEDGALSAGGDLDVLHKPWRNGWCGQMLARLEVDLSLSGNAYFTRVDDRGRFGRAATGPGSRMSQLRPDWVTIIVGSPDDDPLSPFARIVGYLYEPRGGGLMQTGSIRPDGWLLTADQVAHYTMQPDPAAQWRGMSWLSPVLDEIQGDRSANRHKRKFFDNGATLGIVVSMPKEVGPKEFDFFRKAFMEGHVGADNAYRTLFLGGGADPKVVSADMQQLDFTRLSGVAETRIASAGGAHPVVVGMSEGMQGSSLNAGNFGQVRRLFIDGTMEWLWLSVAGALETLVTPPAGKRLAANTRHINFLRDDRTAVAEVQRTQAIALRQLLDAGFTPDAAVAAITADDMSGLTGQHSGRFSIQLQPDPEDEGDQGAGEGGQGE